MSFTAKLANQLYAVPFPLFGTLGLFGLASRSYARTVPLFLPWTFPVVVGGTWFLWYFLGDEVKQDMGLWRQPAAPFTPNFGGATSAKAVEAAKIKAEVAQGNYSSLYAKWDKRLEKMIKPGDDDDDDDEEEEEEEEEEEVSTDQDSINDIVRN
jgi:hypothetical protein